MAKSLESTQYGEYDAIPTNTAGEGIGLGVRHTQAALLFLCLAAAYGMRVIMGVAIVAMTDGDTPQDRNITVFDWNKQTQDFILSSFFCGYMVMQIPGGYLAHKYGAKPLVATAMLANGVTAVLMPIAAQMSGWIAVCICRVIQGLAQGALLPTLHTLMGKWAPASERARLTTLVYGGSQLGSVVSFPLAGWAASSSYGWPSIFWASGSLCLAGGAAYIALGAESPQEHKTITQKERNYIQESLGQKNGHSKALRVPWRQILTCPAVWALSVAHIGSAWVQLTLMTEIPSYLNKVLNINIKANGVLSALPFLGMWICSFIFSYLADLALNKKMCSFTTARKIGNTVALWGVSFGLVVLSFVPADNIHLAIAILVVSASLKAGIYVGFHVNHIDLSPNFAGTMMGISNCLANMCGTMAPITAGLILKDDRDPKQWMTVFFISAGLCFVANLFYIIFGSAEIQPWNDAVLNEVDRSDCEIQDAKDLGKKYQKKSEQENVYTKEKT